MMADVDGHHDDGTTSLIRQKRADIADHASSIGAPEEPGRKHIVQAKGQTRIEQTQQNDYAKAYTTESNIADRVRAYDGAPQESRKNYGWRGQASVQNDHVSINVNNLANNMREKFRILRPVSDSLCIYRVPDHLRDLNEKAYTPQIVSIGPFHHGEEKLALMEDEKRRYLQHFLNRSNVSMEELFRETLETESRLRESYAGKLEFTSEDFVTMMVVDGSFILEYLLRRRLRDSEPNDQVFNKQRLTNTIRYDLLLLENQMPFFYLDRLYSLSDKPELRKGSLSTIKLVRRFLEESTGWDWLVKDSKDDLDIDDVQHILHFLSICLLPPEPRQGQQLKIRASPSIVELHSAGVKFKSCSDRHFLDIQFRNGILEIPTWKINDQTEVVFRNLLAFEQCNPSNHYLSDYVAFMDMLINVEQDVELLIRDGVIENLMQDNEAVADLVNNMGKNNVIYDKEFYFSGLVEELNSYCERPWNKWKANLKQEYFKNPWTIISVIAAAFVILLTILQSVTSVLQVI